ncbi:MAG: hypothetical protein F7C34_04470 [Desulfurococcales archaeon]|nr:hypothetical protein [Desulfurococcales archaeon]
MKWKSVLALALMVALILPVASVASASSEESSIGGEITLSPSAANASIVIRVPAPENLTSLDGHGAFELSNGSFTANLSVTGSGSGLDGLIGAIRSSSESTAAYDPDTESITRNATTLVSAHLTQAGAENPMELSFNSTVFTTTSYSLATEAAVSEKRYKLSLYVHAQNETYGNITVNLSLHGNDLSVLTQEELSGEGSATGSLQLVMGENVNVMLNISLSYSYTVNRSERQVNLTADAYIDANNPMMAYQVYLALDGLVRELDIADYVTVEPPSYSNPTTVKVHVAYAGDLDLNETLPIFPGFFLGGVGSGDLASPAILLPSLDQRIRLSYESEATLNVSNGTFALEASSEGRVENASCNATASAIVDIWLDEEEGYIVVEINFTADNVPDTLSLFYAAKTALQGILENATSSLQLIGSGGLELYLDGSPVSQVNITEDVLEDLAVRVGDLLYYSPSEAYALGPNITLPTLVQRVVANGTSKIVARTSFPESIVLGQLSIEFPENATITILGASRISGVLVAGVENASIDLIPSNLSAVPAGPAVVVKNVTGLLQLKIRVDTSAGNLSLLVIHDNGSIELISNVTVEDDYLIANVTAGSTYIPVALAGGTGTGGGGGTTTTGRTTGGTTTPTQTSMPTTTSSAASTTEETTTTTSSPASTSTPAQTQTSTTETQPGGGGVSIKTVTAVVIIIIVIAAALVVAKR